MNKKSNTSKGRKAIIRLIWILFFIGIFGTGTIFYLISSGNLGYIPSFPELENPKNLLATEIITSDGKIMGTYFKENRSNVEYKDISPNLINALIATEDIRFYEHSGIDGRSLLRALYGAATMNMKGGGSTITQQLAKLLYHDPAIDVWERLLQKLNEWVIAVKLEKRYTKEEILTMYFNKFDFLNLAVGIKSASKVYFNTTPDSLKMHEAAMLVGMAKNPSLFNPLRRPDTTKHRRNVVLSQMLKYGYIEKADFDTLKKMPLGLRFQKVDHKLGLAPYFREFLRLSLTAQKPEKDNFYSEQQYIDAKNRWDSDPMYGWCNKNLKDNGEPYDIYRDGLQIYTTINSEMQKYAEEAVTEHMGLDLQKAFWKEQAGRSKAPFSNDLSKEQIDKIMYLTMRRSDRYQTHLRAGLSHDSIQKIFNKPVEMKVFSWKGEIDTVLTPIDSIRYYKHFLRAGMMSMEPNTGYVRAYVGGINYEHFQYDQVSIARRQVGSTFKPFIYTLAMQNGYSPCHLVPNVAVTFIMPEGQPPYTPKFTTAKFLKKYEGKMISLKFGLAHSMNQISAWVLKRFTPQAAIQVARNMGIKSPIEPYPSICVGIPEIRLAELVPAYCTFANKGIFTSPIFVTKIKDKHGNLLANFVPKRKEAISEETAFLMLSLMKGVTEYGTSVRLRYKYKLEGEMAGKTGTTNNHSDGWFMGINPKLVTGVWVGGEERSIHFRTITLGQGANMALPIYAIYMKKIFADKKLSYSEEDLFDKPQKKISIELDCDKYQMKTDNDNDDDLLY